MAYGIGQEIDNLKSIGAARLTKSQAENPDLFTALALQQLTSEQAAAGRQQSMNPQPALPQGNLMQQMGAELSQTLPQPMVNRLAPGIQQQGQRSMQSQGPQMSQGISGVPANNMGAIGRAGGGIIEYAKGGSIPVGNSNQPIPMLMEKYGAKRVNQFIAEQKRLNDKARALAEAGPAAGSMQIEDHKLMKQVFSEKYRDILNESMGMARGGIVGYAPGGRIKGFEERVVVADEQVRAYLSSLGRDITDFTAEQIAAVKEMLNSQVARSQNDIMSQVGRGAMGAIADVVPDTAMSQGQIGAREAQLESGRGGIGSALSNLGSMVNSEEAQAARQELQQVMQGTNREPSVTDQLLAADLRRRAENKPEGGIMNALRNTFSMPSEAESANFRDMMGTGSRGQEEGTASEMSEQPMPAENEGGIMNALRNTFSMPSEEENAARARAKTSIDSANPKQNAMEFLDGLGVAGAYDAVKEGVSGAYDTVRGSDFFSGLPSYEELYPPLPEDAGGAYGTGRAINAAVTTPFKVLGGFLQPDEGPTLSDLGTGVENLGRGIIGVDPRREEVAEDIQQIDTETDANGVPTESVVARLPSVRAGDLDAVVGSSATSATPVASSATTPVSGFTADQTDRFGKMMQGAKDENFLNEYVGTISPNGDAGTGAATQKTGIAGLLQKVKPYADKASDIAKILGRGAGASEGFEFSQIAQKSAEREAEDRLAARNAEIADKLFSRQTERDTTGFEQQKTLDEMGIEASMDELTYRVDKAAELADTELTAQMRTDLVVAMQSDAALSNALEAMKGDYTTGGGDFIPFNERFDAEGYNKAAFKLRDEWLANQMRLIRPGQTSTAPATERYSVSES